jgi:(p)ppGpp synthase/HD superfamily hydrolase
MSLKIISAARFAAVAHQGQKRKYNGRPYIEHPGRVAARITRFAESTEDWIAAAWCHDVIEDCNVSLDDMRLIFGHGFFVTLVDYLTNPSKQHPNLSREARKQMDREHLARAPFAAQCIKLVDRADNLREMTDAPIPFKRLYCEESRLLLGALRGSGLLPAADELVSEFEEAITFLEDSIEYPDIERN